MNLCISILLFISPIISITYADRRSTGRALKRHNRLGHHPKHHNFPHSIQHKLAFIENSGGHLIPYHESVYGHGVRVYDKYPRFNYSALHYKLTHRTPLTHYVKPDSDHRAPYMSHIYGYGVPYHYHHQQQPQHHHKPQPQFNATAVDVICDTPHKRHAFDRLGLDICKRFRIPHHHIHNPNLPAFEKTDGHKLPFDDKTPPNPASILDSYCEDSHHHELFEKHRINICEDHSRPDSDPIVTLKSYCENEQQKEFLTRLGVNICKDYKHYILPLIDKRSHHQHDDSHGATLESACKNSRQREHFSKLGITICDELEIPDHHYTHKSPDRHHTDKSHHNPGATLDNACNDAKQRAKFEKLGMNICKDHVLPPHADVSHDTTPHESGSFCDPSKRHLWDQLRKNVCKLSAPPGFNKHDGYRLPHKTNLFGFRMPDDLNLYDKRESSRFAKLVVTTTTSTTSAPFDPCADEHQRELFIRLGITLCQ